MYVRSNVTALTAVYTPGLSMLSKVVQTTFPVRIYSTMSTSCLSLTFRQMWKETLTTVIHAVEPGNIYSTEVQPLANDLVKKWYGGGDRGDAFILVEGQRSVVHDGLIIIRRVQIGDEVILILIEVVLLPCEERVTLPCR